MSQRGTMERLIQLADEYGVIQAIGVIFGKSISVKIPFSEKSCKTSIDLLDLSVRANNALKRAGLLTIDDVITIINEQQLGNIRNLGRKTENEIKTRLLAFGYSALSDCDKQQFFEDLCKSCS